MDILNFAGILNKKIEEGLEKLESTKIGTEEYDLLMKSIVNTMNLIGTLMGDDDNSSETDQGRPASEPNEDMIKVGDSYEDYKGDE